MQNLTEASAVALCGAIRRREVSSLEVVDAHLEKIRALNGPVNAIVTLDEEGARARAKEADAALAKGEVWGALHGLPMTLKDGHLTAGMRTTAGHPPLAQNIPENDGTIASRVKKAGAIILGKTNVSPLLMDIQADNPIFGRTNNPWDLTRTSGGSSGGAAAALAARLTPLEIGSDFAGSIRLPAHFCGVWGLKPTEQRVPMAGHIPEPISAARTPSLWSSGPLARNAEDLSLALQVIAGADAAHPEVPPVPPPESTTVEASALRIAWAPTFPGVPVSNSIREALKLVADAMANAGARVEEALPDLSWEEQARVRVKLAKALDPAQPTMISAKDYFEALDKRAALVSAWERWFASYDALLCPVAMVSAFRHCASNTSLDVDAESTSYWKIIGHCAPFNLTGHPVVVVPVARDSEGLPIGIQVVGARWTEGRLLAVASAVSRIVGPIGKPPVS